MPTRKARKVRRRPITSSITIHWGSSFSAIRHARPQAQNAINRRAARNPHSCQNPSLFRKKARGTAIAEAAVPGAPGRKPTPNQEEHTTAIFPDLLDFPNNSFVQSLSDWGADFNKVYGSRKRLLFVLPRNVARDPRICGRIRSSPIG
jgi:hypothetical protein